MDIATFLGLKPGSAVSGDRPAPKGNSAAVGPTNFLLPVLPEITTPGGFLFGGAGLAAAVSSLETATGRKLIWATAQFLSYARPPAELAIDVEILVSGHQVTQARVMAYDTNTGTDILTVNAALGTRKVPVSGVWETMPVVAPPEDCVRRDDPPDLIRNTIFERFDLRLAAARPYSELTGEPAGGTCAMWVRVPEGLEASAAQLALVGDWVPFGFGQALGQLVGGNSLDNTIRIINPEPSSWLLLDVRIHGIANGFGHGVVHIWGESGNLLATASQSSIVRVWNADRLAAMRETSGASADVPQLPQYFHPKNRDENNHYAKDEKGK